MLQVRAESPATARSSQTLVAIALSCRITLSDGTHRMASVEGSGTLAPPDISCIAQLHVLSQLGHLDLPRVRYLWQ